MPVAAVVSGAVLVLHGGIGDGLWSLQELRASRRPISDEVLDDESVNHILANVLWSDPIDGIETSPANRNTQVHALVVVLRVSVARDSSCFLTFERSRASAGGIFSSSASTFPAIFAHAIRSK